MEATQFNGMEMPHYKCHKEVWALKIKSVEQRNPTIKEIDNILHHDGDPPGGTIIPGEPGYAPIQVSRGYILKHNPQAGGYYVVYADGYKSYSPAKAFEEGYERI